MPKKLEYMLRPICENPAIPNGQQLVKAALDEVGKDGWHLVFKDGQWFYFVREAA